MSSFSERYQSEIEALHQKSRTRKLSLGEGVDFTSNDFLALSESDSIRQAVSDALDSGVPLGSGGSRLLRGNHPAHIELEEKAAHYFNCEKSLYFANGYSANFALLTSLPKRHDLIIFDALSHAKHPGRHFRIIRQICQSSTQRCRCNRKGSIQVAFDPLPKLTGMDCSGKYLQYGWRFCTAHRTD